MKTPLLILAIGMGIAWVICKAAQRCFDDEDPDLDWYDNYKVENCPHTGDKTLVNVSSACNCEIVHTVCDDCGATLKVDIDCP